MKLKKEKSKQPAKIKPSKQVFKKTSMQFTPEIYLKIKNTANITGRNDWEVVDQALRELFGMPIPTIKDQIQESK